MIDGQKLTYAQFKEKKKRREVTHTLVTDDDARVAFDVADERLRRARARSDKVELAEAEAAHEEAEAALRAATIVMRLRALPRKGENSFAALKAEHAPTEDDNKKVQADSGDPKARALWHIDTFGPALISACLIEPEMTVDEVTAESEDMNEAEWNGLVWAAISVNQQATNTDGLVFS